MGWLAMVWSWKAIITNLKHQPRCSNINAAVNTTPAGAAGTLASAGRTRAGPMLLPLPLVPMEHSDRLPLPNDAEDTLLQAAFGRENARPSVPIVLRLGDPHDAVVRACLAQPDVLFAETPFPFPTSRDNALLPIDALIFQRLLSHEWLTDSVRFVLSGLTHF